MSAQLVKCACGSQWNVLAQQVNCEPKLLGPDDLYAINFCSDR